MITYAKEYPAVMLRLPIEKEIPHLPRNYIGDVIYTIVGDPFYKWKDDKIEVRNRKLAEKQDQFCDMDPEIAAAFRASTAISCKYSYALSLL